MNIRDNLPEGWSITALENTVEVLDSRRVPINNTERQNRIEGKSKEDLFPYYGATGEVGKIDDYLFDEELVALGEDGVPFLDHKKNKAYMLRGKTWVNNHAHVLKALEGTSLNQYILYFLNQFDYQDYVNGGTRLKLTQKNMRQIPILVAPLAEQRVIADKLNSLLAQVEMTKERLDRVPDILKRFRQSVLAAAVSGRLTEEWREHCAVECNVLKLGRFDPKKIEEESELFNIPDTWSWHHLGDLVSVHNSIRVPLKKADRDNRSGEYAYYGAFGIIDDIDDFLFDGEFILLAEDGKNLESRQRPISLLASGKFWVNNHAHVLRAETGVLNHYLNMFLNSPVVLIDQFLTGQDQVKLNRKAMSLIPIATPSLEEQTEIVRRVEELFACADAVEQKVQAASERVNKLTQSILAKAFRGELTAEWRAENPDLISGENSAEALLEKIKAEREALKPKKKTRAKKVKG